MTGAQLSLGLYAEPQADFADFVGETNVLALTRVRAWASGAAPWCVGLWGATAVGKTHLLQASIRSAAEHGRTAMYLPLKELLAHGPDLLEGLEALQALALDDLDCLAGDTAWEEAVFDLYNRCQAAGHALLYAMHDAPAAMRFALPDLRSRLSAALIFQVLEPTQAEKPRVLQAVAARRGMALPEAVASFLINRLPRASGELMAALEKLDAASLSEGRTLTVPFVRETLGLKPD